MIIIIIIEGLSIKHLRVVATTDMEVSTIRNNRRNLRKIKWIETESFERKKNNIIIYT